MSGREMNGSGFTDLHHHVLWGVDDGPKMPEQMVAMLELAVRNNVVQIAATSHAYPKYEPFDLAKYQERLAEANLYCCQQGWELRLISGCEIHYCSSVPDMLIAGKLPTLGGTRMVLIEFDIGVTVEQIMQAASSLYRVGYQPIVAHVERYRCMVRSARQAMDIREDCGLFLQMNCETVLHPRGFWEKRFVRSMLEAQAIDLVASDAHDTSTRPVLMQNAYCLLAEKYGSAYAHRLTHFDITGGNVMPL